MPRAEPDLRVVIVSDAEPERNGVATYYRDLADELAPHGTEVTFLSPGQGDPSLPHWLRIALPGDATQRLGIPSPPAVAQRLRALRPNVVVIATPGPYGLIAHRAARRLRARCVFGLHTHYEALSDLYWRGVRRRVNRWALRAANRHLIHHADTVVTNAGSMSTLARRLGARRPHETGTLLPRSFIEPLPAAIPDRAESVLFIGRLAAEKRLDALIDAAAEMPWLAFHIIGDGPQRERVAAAAARLPNLVWRGWLSRAEVIPALDAADLLVLPSELEAFGTVALEALARGRPTLVSRGCGIAEWPAFRRGLHRIGDGERPADAIHRVLALDVDLRRHRAEQGRAAALRMHETTLADWLALLRGDAPGLGTSPADQPCAP